jgi:hypothetical protein
MSLVYPFFEWCESTWLSQQMRNSRAAFPIAENFHLFALTVLLGTLVILGLREYGVFLKHQPVSELAAELRPWTMWSLAVMLVSGILLFLSEALKCYNNTSFRIKMLFLFMALVFQFGVYNRVLKAGGESTTRGGKVAATIALALWFGVGLGGRAIGFLG